MKDTIELDGFAKTTRKVFRVSNGKVESRAIRDFFESDLEVGDMVDVYRVTRKQTVTVHPGDRIVRLEGTHVIG